MQPLPTATSTSMQTKRNRQNHDIKNYPFEIAKHHCQTNAKLFHLKPKDANIVPKFVERTSPLRFVDIQNGARW
jgi:hypothetical protein